jgi:hypothetical protein
MEIGTILNHDLASARQRPAWYRGEQLTRSLYTKTCGELNGHALDEIIDEKLTNTKFAWTGEKGIASFLGLSTDTLKCMIQTWNEHKILFAAVNADAPDIERAIFKIIPGKHGIRCWQRYRHFVDSGGCRLPVDPAILFQHLHTRTKTILKLSPNISSWNEFRRINVGTVGVNAGLFP